ncbi:MAG: signal transduction histidine kinase [Verrucomicrobiales bacterium]
MPTKDDSPQQVHYSILLIEDNPADRTLFCELLRPENNGVSRPHEPQVDWRIQTAESLAEATSILNAADSPNKIDAIVLNLSLPDSQGLMTFTRIKEMVGEGKAPILVLSGDPDAESLSSELIHLGAQDFLPKDILRPDLVGRSILNAIERHRHAQERATFQTTIDRLDSVLETSTDEVSNLRNQLIQSEKLESLGRLAAGVAHEVKNPLAMLQMGIDFFNNRRTDGDETETKMLEIMREALVRADRIVVDMVDFSKPKELRIKPESVNKMLERAIRMVGPELKHHDIRLERNYAEDLPDAMADRDKIEQVLINLLINAIHASEDGASLEVATDSITPEDLVNNHGERRMNKIRQGNEILALIVRDHGSGIPPDKLDKIFEPFFTTKPTGVGTGLGLSVSNTIVELHGGRLRIKNAEPEGVRAEIFLRISPESSVKSTETTP